MLCFVRPNQGNKSDQNQGKNLYAHIDMIFVMILVGRMKRSIESDRYIFPCFHTLDDRAMARRWRSRRPMHRDRGLGRCMVLIMGRPWRHGGGLADAMHGTPGMRGTSRKGAGVSSSHACPYGWSGGSLGCPSRPKLGWRGQVLPGHRDALRPLFLVSHLPIRFYSNHERRARLILPNLPERVAAVRQSRWISLQG